MDRRDFLRTTGAIAATAVGCAGSRASALEATAASRSSFTFTYPWLSHHAGFADEAHRLARQIEAALAGSRTFDIHAASNAPSDFTVAPVGADTSRHPAFAYFAGLPGTESLSPRDLETWLAIAGGQELWDGLCAPHGCKPLLAGHTGSSPVLWSKSLIARPEDFAGMRVVARGLDAQVIRALGATALEVDEVDLEEALSAPDTSAAVWGSLVQSAAAGLPQMYPYALTGALGTSGQAIALKISLPVWQSLTEAEQAAIANVANAAFRAGLADTESTRGPVEQAVAARHGTAFSRPSADFSAAISRIAAAVVAHTAAHDSTSAYVDRSYGAYLRLTVRDAAVLG